MRTNQLILVTGVLAVLAGLLVAASWSAAAGGITTLAVIFIGAFPITVIEERRRGRTMSRREMTILSLGLLIAAIGAGYVLLQVAG